jgi:hypothetical protein
VQRLEQAVAHELVILDKQNVQCDPEEQI